MESNTEKEKNEELETIIDKYDDCMYLNRLGLLLIGIWPLEQSASNLHFLFRQIHLCVIYSFIIFLLMMQWLDIYYFWGNIDATSETFMTNIFIFAVMMKITNFLKSMDIFKV